GLVSPSASKLILTAPGIAFGSAYEKVVVPSESVSVSFAAWTFFKLYFTLFPMKIIPPFQMSRGLHRVFRSRSRPLFCHKKYRAYPARLPASARQTNLCCLCTVRYSHC